MNKMQAKSFLNEYVAREYLENGGMRECNDKINDQSREVIYAYHNEDGECWLGSINLYDDDRTALWKYEGQFVYNFGAGFVVPRYDAELEKMILERRDAQYNGMKKDMILINSILDRISRLGGYLLTWT